MQATAKAEGWTLRYGGIALLWRGGCIIRSVFLERIKEAFDRNPELGSLLLDPFFTREIRRCQRSWRRAVAAAVGAGIPVPCLGGALAYYDALRCARLPANLLQAQRDYFGAHTYERVDRPRGEFHHTDWTGHGGSTASSVYGA
jgi:6-phosphogluconate dehydrogenase